MDLAWLTLLALVAVVVLSCTTRLNPGVAAIVLAWLIAAIIAPHFGQSLGEKAIAAGFPAELFLTLVGVSLLFGQAEANGTLQRAAGAMLRLVGGSRGLVPWLYFALAFLLGSAGPGNIAVAALIAPLAMQSASRLGISPLLMAALVGHGAIASTVSPFTAAGVVTNQKLADIGIEHAAWQVFAWNAAANALAAAIAYAVLGGFRLWTSKTEHVLPLQQSHASEDSVAGSASWQHWLTAAIIALVLAAVAIGKVHIGLAAFCGAAALILLRAGDDAAGLARVPWGVILMVSGVSVLTSLLDKTGGSQRFAALIGTASTPATLPAVVALVTGLVSIYSSTTGVVLPAFLPMVGNLASLHAGGDPLNLALAVLVGGNLVDMSPLSTIGALCLAAVRPGLDRRRLFNRLLAWGFAMTVLGTAISAAFF